MPESENQQLDHPIDLDQLGRITAVLLLAMALIRYLDAPVRPLLQVTILGSAVGLDLSVTKLMLLIILGLSLTGTISVVGRHPQAQVGTVKWVMVWIVPGLLNLGLAVWLNRINGLSGWIIGLVVTAPLIAASIMTEYRAADPEARAKGSLQWMQMLLIYLTAVILFSLIYDARSRSLLSASAVMLVTTLLAARLFWIKAIPMGKAFSYGSITALILAQATWGLNYWHLTGLQGGLFLLMLFYVVAGVLQQFLWGQIDWGHNGRRILLEYGGATIIILLLIALVAP